MATTVSVAYPRLRQIGTAAALTAGVVLILKAMLIIGTANAVSETAMGVLYVIGVALPLVAAAGIASPHHGRAKQAGIYLGVILAHLFFLTFLSDGLKGAVGVFSEQAYVIDEVPVALLGLAWLATGLWMRISDRR